MLIMNWNLIKYFNPLEFSSPDDRRTGRLMHQGFMFMLDEARKIAGIPFRINSGFRTIAHNKKINGSSNSSHLIGQAADIKITSSRNRFIILNALLQVGFTRIGIYENFIHVDNDPDKIQNVIWYNS